MWLELKILLSIFAMVFIAVVLSQVLVFNAVFAFILIAAIVMIFMGDVLIGYQIKHNHLDVLMDACPPGEEICVLFDFSGNIDFLRTRKGPLGTRQFVRYKKRLLLSMMENIRCVLSMGIMVLLVMKAMIKMFHSILLRL